MIVVISLQIIFSKSFGITNKINIQFLATLQNRNDKGLFPKAGKMPVNKNRLNRSVSGTLTTETNFLSMGGKTLSDPRPFCSPNPKMGSLTAVCVSWKRDALCDSYSSSGKVSSVGSTSFTQTPSKNSANKFTTSSGLEQVVTQKTSMKDNPRSFDSYLQASWLALYTAFNPVMYRSYGIR
jgi:hypothetical protein